MNALALVFILLFILTELTDRVCKQKMNGHKKYKFNPKLLILLVERSLLSFRRQDNFFKYYLF